MSPNSGGIDPVRLFLDNISSVTCTLPVTRTPYHSRKGLSLNQFLLFSHS